MKKGFTLVELSIVLVIIGLLIGGILVGQSMVNSSRINKVIEEAQQYQAMMDNFKTTYNYYPGDMPSGMLGTSCANNGGNGCHGNGNGIIGETVFGYYGEACRFWQHLTIVGYLKYTLTPQNSNAGGCVSGLDTPKSAYSKNAYWHFAYAANSSSSLPGASSNLQHYFMLYGGTTANSCFGREMACNNIPAGIKPMNALAIDKKIDDGHPLTGNVLAGNSNNSVLASAPYDVQNRYCLYSTNQYAAPIDYPSWSYYKSYNEDNNGCALGIKANLN